MLGAFLCAFTELRGLKGRLFWLPMWTLLIAASIFIALINSNDRGTSSFTTLEFPQFKYIDYYFLLYIIAVLIIFYFYKNLNKFMMQKWEVSKTAMLELNNLEVNETNKEKFWELINIAYFKPSPLFYFAPGSWSKVYKNSLSEKEYIDHTVRMLKLLNDFEVEQKLHKKWIENFYNSCKNAEKLHQFTPPFMGFRRLEEYIKRNS